MIYFLMPLGHVSEPETIMVINLSLNSLLMAARRYPFFTVSSHPPIKLRKQFLKGTPALA